MDDLLAAALIYWGIGTIVCLARTMQVSDFARDIGPTWGSMFKMWTLWPLFLFIKPRMEAPRTPLTGE